MRLKLAHKCEIILFTMSEPLSEGLALKSPEDPDVLLGLGVCLVAESTTLDDENAAANERVRAGQVLLKAKKLDNTAPLENILQTIGKMG